MTDKTPLEQLNEIETTIEQLRSAIHNLQTGGTPVDDAAQRNPLLTKEGLIRLLQKNLSEAEEDHADLLKRYPDLNRLRKKPG